MKVQVKFSERVDYDVDLEVADEHVQKAFAAAKLDAHATAAQKADALREYLEYGGKHQGEGVWFELLEEQYDNWVTGHGVGLAVSEREVEEIVTPFDSVAAVLQRKTVRP